MNVLNWKRKISDSLGLKTVEIKYLRFENVYNINKPIIQVYNPQKNTKKEVIISPELYDDIKQYKNELKKSASTLLD